MKLALGKPVAVQQLCIAATLAVQSKPRVVVAVCKPAFTDAGKPCYTAELDPNYTGNLPSTSRLRCTTYDVQTASRYAK